MAKDWKSVGWLKRFPDWHATQRPAPKAHHFGSIGLTDYYIGIDPGKTGGLVCLGGDGELKWAHVMPEDPRGVSSLILHTGSSMRLIHVILEKAQAMPKNGAVSMFNYGLGFGIIQGIILAHGVRHTLVRPGAWAKVMHQGTTGDDAKKRSLEAARRLCPSVTTPPTPRSKKAHEGLVDAYLIAEWGRRQRL